MKPKRHIGFTVFFVCIAAFYRLATLEPEPQEVTLATQRWGSEPNNEFSLDVIRGLRYYILGVGFLGLIIVAEDYFNDWIDRKKRRAQEKT